MDATADAKRRSNPSVGDDRISSLCDDLLLRILDLVGAADARDAARTGALSRRWRGLWTRAAALRFGPGPEDMSDSGEARFVASVDHALAQTVAGAVKHLEIEFHTCGTFQPARPAIEALERWIRYAMQHAVTSLRIEVTLFLKIVDGIPQYSEENHVMMPPFDDELVGSANKLETMSLSLGGTILRFPAAATMAFHSLKDLTIHNIIIDDESDHLLAQLLSSTCCPRLQKLRMRRIFFSDTIPDADNVRNVLLLQAGALTELMLEDVYPSGYPPLELQLQTPNLKVLSIQGCELEVLTISSAPSLEELTLLQSPYLVEINADLSRVRRLKFDSNAESYGVRMNYMSFNLLQRCTGATCLDVSLHAPQGGEHVIDDTWHVDIEPIENLLPGLHYITSLTVHVNLKMRHCFDNSGVPCLLSMFFNIRYLSLHLEHISIEKDRRRLSFCRNSDHWKSSGISLPHLQVAELKGLTGSHCEFQFLWHMLARSPNLRKVVLSFSNKVVGESSRRDEFRRLLLGNGTWTVHHDPDETFVWRPC